MRIFDSIRGHFALRVGRPLHTLAHKKPFTIEHVVPKPEQKENWFIVLRLSSGGRQLIYLTDLIKVYFWILRTRRGLWISLKEIKDVIDIGKGQSSYLMALLATFDDICVKADGTAIRFVPPEEEY